MSNFDVQAENLQKPPAQQQPMPEWLQKVEKETQAPAVEQQAAEATETSTTAEVASVDKKRVDGVRIRTQPAYRSCDDFVSIDMRVAVCGCLSTVH